MSHLKFLRLYLCSLGKNPYVTRYLTASTLDYYMSFTVHHKWDTTGAGKYCNFFLLSSKMGENTD